MSQPEQFDILILGSGKSGKLLAWHMAQSGRRAAVVERRWIGGSCPNIACLPSKNEIWSAKVAHLAREGVRFGVVTGPVATDMATVVKRKRDMVESFRGGTERQITAADGVDLIHGEACFRDAHRVVALQLPPGRYAVTFSLPGFTTVVQENVLVTVGEAARLNPTMKVSSIAETVTVTLPAAPSPPTAPATTRAASASHGHSPAQCGTSMTALSNPSHLRMKR